jgi:iron complex outermembrane receptor protein
MTYVKYSTGYRAGGFNVRATAAGNPIYLPEKMKSVEGGFKVELFEHRLRLNGAAFYNKYRDLQVAQFAPPSTTGTGGSSAVNANAHYPGFELEAVAVPVERLTLNASFGYVNPKYDAFPQALLTGNVVAGGCKPIAGASGAAVGMDCAHIAKFQGISKRTFNLGASYSLPATGYGVWSGRIDYVHKSRTDWSNVNLPSTPFQEQIAGKPYGLLSGRIALSDIPLNGGARAQISVYGDNLTNKHYIMQGIDFGFMGTDVFSPPRSFGIDAKVDF